MPSHSSCSFTVTFAKPRNIGALSLVVFGACFISSSNAQQSPIQNDPPELGSSLHGAAKTPAPDVVALAAALDNNKDGRVADTISKVSDVIGRYPSSPDAHYMRLMIGYCQSNIPYPEMMNDVNEALRYFSPADNSMIGSPQALYVIRSKLKYRQGSFAEAIDDLEHAMLMAPHKAGMLFDEDVTVTSETQSLPCAWTVPELSELASKFPNDYRIPLFLGLWYDYHGFYEEQYYRSALSQFQHALFLNPKSGLVHYFIGQHIESTLPKTELFSTASVETQNDRKLLQEYGTAVALDPTIAGANMSLANIQTYLKRPTLALRAYNRAVEISPTEHSFLNRRAQFLMDTGDYNGAISDFTEAINNCHDSALLLAYYQQRGEMYMKAGNTRGAIDDYSMSLRLILETATPILVGRTQFRKLYPEYDALSDRSLAARLQPLLRPGWSIEDFLTSFTKADEESGLVAYELANNYEHRAEANWSAKHYRASIRDYQRIFSGLSNHIKQYPDSVNRWQPFLSGAQNDSYIDVRTVESSRSPTIKLWLKSQRRQPEKTAGFDLDEIQINCSSKLLNTLSTTSYDVKGNVVKSSGSSGWQRIVPDTLGESLYGGMCVE